MKLRNGTSKIIGTIVIALSLLAAFLSPAAAAGGVLSVDMKAFYGVTNAKNVNIPAGAPFQFILNYGCTTATPCTSPKITVPFAANLQLGNATAVGWEETRNGNFVTWSRASIPSSSAGSISIYATIPAYTTPHGQVFSQTATMSGFQSSTVVDTAVNVTAQVGSETVANVELISGGGLNSNSTYKASVCLVEKSGYGPQGVQSGSQATIALPEGATLIDNGGGTAIGSALRFTLPAIENYGCVEKIYKVAFNSDDPSNVPDATKTTEINWVGQMQGGAPTTLGTDSSSIVIPDPDGGDENTISAHLATPRSGPGSPSGRAWTNEEVTENFTIANSTTSRWDYAIVSSDISSWVRAISAAGKVVGEGPAELFIKRNGGDLEKIYEFDGNQNYNINFYNDEDFPTGVSKLDPSDNVTYVELRLNGVVQPGESATGLSLTSTVRSTNRDTGLPLNGGDIGTFNVGAKVKYPGKEELVDAVLEPLEFMAQVPGFYTATRFNCVGPTDCGNLPVGVSDATGRIDFIATNNGAVPNPVPEPVMVLTLPKEWYSLKTPNNPTDSFRWLGPSEHTPTLSGIEEVNLDGVVANVYRWTFAPGTVIPNDSVWSMEVDFQMDPTAPQGSYSGLRSPIGWVSSATQPVTDGCGGGNWWYGGPDKWDLNNNGNTTEVLCSWGTNTNPAANPGYSISQSLKGAWDADFSTSPGVSYSDPESTNQLRSSIKNTGNVPLTDAILLTTMVRPGDTHILTSAPRSPSVHTFPINVAGKPTVPNGAKVWWTTSAFPCVPDVLTNPNCEDSVWTDWDATAPSDLAGVGAIKVTFEGMTLAPGATWSSTTDVVTPDTVSPDVGPCVTESELADPPCEPTFAIPNTVNPLDEEDNEIAIGTSAGIAKRSDLNIYLAALESPDATLSMPGVGGPNPEAPEPEALESQGDYGVPQSTIAWYPPYGTITLLDQDDNPVDSVEVKDGDGNKVGTYALDPSTCGTAGRSGGECEIVFTPETTFAGGFPTAVKYQVANAYNQTGQSTYQAFVIPPAAPDPHPVTSSGVGVAPQQSEALEVPEDGELCILDSMFQCSLTNEVTIAGVGTFTLDPDTRIVTFVAELGYSGSSRNILYQVTDKLGQTGINTYTPTVTKPAGPTATAVVAEAPLNSSVEFELDLPENVSVQILDTDGMPAGNGPVTLAGKGTYTVDGARLIFTPENDWSGTPEPIVYRVTDVYDQSAESTFTPTVWGAAPVPVDETSEGPMKGKQSVTVPPPSGGQVKLLDCGPDPCEEVTQLEVPGEGTYTVDPETGEIQFQPEDDFTGAATSIRYRVTDDKNQHGDASYTPTVWPASPNPSTQSTEGPMGTDQSVDITVPTNGSVLLLECDPEEPNDCEVVDSVAIPDVGVYSINDEGKITFSPAPDFTGAAPAVKYRVIDEHDQTGESTYTATVWDAAPDADPLSTEGPMGEDQTITVAPPHGGEVKLVDASGDPVDKVTVAGEGEYVVNPATGLITFTPEPNFNGQASPISYRVIDAHGQSNTSTYTPTVWDQAPQPENQTSQGPMSANQTVTVAPPSGGATKLLDCDGDECEPVDELTVSGIGTYTVDANTGEIVFSPTQGFWGTAPAVKFRLIDAKGQYGDATYQPQVWNPAPSPNDRTSRGAVAAKQTITVPRPEGGLVQLVDGAELVDQLEVPGEGTYVVDPETGVVTFTPDADFVGIATPVTFRVTDEFGQTGEATYTPTVIPAPVVTTVGPKQGPLSGGNKLTVTGSNLKSATVKVGGKTCTNVVVNEDGTSLTCTIPSGTRPGGVAVSVTTPGGSESVTAAYTYVATKVEKPLRPGGTTVQGKAKSKKITVSWQTPVNRQGIRPTQWYRIKLNLRGCQTLILNKKLGKNRHSYTFSRNYLLKHSKCKRSTRGEVVANVLFYRVRVEAFNSKGGGPVATRHFKVLR